MKAILAALGWFLFIMAAVCAESEDRRSVAEDLVRELRELERAVERGSDPQDSPQTPADPSGSVGQGETPSDVGDSQTPTETLGGENSTETMEHAVDTAENALEKAAERAEDVLETNTQQAEERLEEETERAEEEIEEAVEEAEEEMEEGRGKKRGKGRGRGLGRSGKMKNKSREGYAGMPRRDREERRRDRKQGAEMPGRMTPEERRQRRQARKQTRSLERLVRFLEKRLELLEKAVPEENRDAAMFDVVRGLLDNAKKLLVERKAKESTATTGNDPSPSQGESTTGTAEGEAPGNVGESSSELTPSSTRELKELLRLLVSKNL